MRLTIATYKAIKYACLNFHYAKAVPVIRIGYNVYNDADDWCGVIIFGPGANMNSGKHFGLFNGQFLELVRVALNGKQSSTSQALAMTLKQLRKDCPLCRLVVSYADCDQNHLGTIYQATNWVYVGKMLQGHKDGSWIVNGKRVHHRVLYDWQTTAGCRSMLFRDYILSLDKDATPYTTKGKQKYLYPLDKQMRKQIMPLMQPYPKDENWQKIDRSKYNQNSNSK